MRVPERRPSLDRRTRDHNQRECQVGSACTFPRCPFVEGCPFDVVSVLSRRVEVNRAMESPFEVCFECGCDDRMTSPRARSAGRSTSGPFRGFGETSEAFEADRPVRSTRRTTPAAASTIPPPRSGRAVPLAAGALSRDAVIGFSRDSSSSRTRLATRKQTRANPASHQARLRRPQRSVYADSHTSTTAKPRRRRGSAGRRTSDSRRRLLEMNLRSISHTNGPVDATYSTGITSISR